MKLRVGIVGLGESWEAHHRAALRSLQDRYEVRAVCADVTAKAERAARDFNADVSHGFRALSQRPDIDAVLMLSADWYGPLPILAACEAGKAIYCGAALDMEPRLAAEIRDRVDRSGVAFMAEFPRRQAPATLRLKELIATRLGKPKLLFCHTRQSSDPSGDKPAGRSNGAQPSELRELLEIVDWCRYIVDREPTSVLSAQHCDGQGQTDYQMMSLDFESENDNTLVQISCGRYLRNQWHEAISFRPPAGLQVCCQNGVAFADLPNTLVWFDEAGRHLESLDSDRPVGEQLLTQFHRAVTSLVRNMSDLEDAHRALQIVLGAKRSHAEGGRITL